MIYPISFFTSALSLSVCSFSKKRWAKTIFFIIAVAIPILIATFRSESNGIDVRVYVKPYANYAINSPSFGNYLSYMLNQHVELGYSLINYVGAKYLGGLSGVFFLCQIITIIPVYLRLLECDDTPVFVSSIILLI